MLRVLVITIMSLLATKAIAGKVTAISAEEMLSRIEAEVEQLVLDVRSEQEFGEGHLPGAINIPYDQLPKRLSELSKNVELVVYCRSGRRADIAEKTLLEAGFTQVSDLAGHWNQWQKQGFPSE